MADIFAVLTEDEHQGEALYDRLMDVTAPNRVLDTRFAKELNIYRHYLDGLATDEEIKSGFIFIYSVEYDLAYDQAKIKIRTVQNPRGGIQYTDKVPAFTSDPAAMKNILPNDAEWQVSRTMVDHWPLYTFTYRGKEFTAPHEALAICRGVAFFMKNKE